MKTIIVWLDKENAVEMTYHESHFKLLKTIEERE